jgi:hypothetical protein
MKWEPLPPFWIKVNVDGAFSEDRGRADVGVLIRSHHGAVLLSTWRVYLMLHP